MKVWDGKKYLNEICNPKSIHINLFSNILTSTSTRIQTQIKYYRFSPKISKIDFPFILQTIYIIVH